MTLRDQILDAIKRHHTFDAQTDAVMRLIQSERAALHLVARRRTSALLSALVDATAIGMLREKCMAELARTRAVLSFFLDGVRRHDHDTIEHETEIRVLEQVIEAGQLEPRFGMMYAKERLMVLKGA